MSVYQVNPRVIKHLISSISIFMVTIYSFAHVYFTPMHRNPRTFVSAKLLFSTFF